MESAQPVDSSPDPMLGRTLGSYRLVRKIAQGGMGAVYEATHIEVGRRAAVKVLLRELVSNPDAANRFFNEAKAVSLVSHPSLATIYEHGTSPDGEAYIIMEYLDGGSLRERLDKHYLGGSAIALVRQMAAALATTHQKRIIHRDLKPENIMLVRDDQAPGGERAKIVDFGIAKLLPDGMTEEDRRSFKTRTGTLIGTPTYMSPEQCRASEPVDEKTDVYSLGLMFYELLYGEPPYRSESAGELFALQMFAPPPELKQRVPAANPKLVELIHRLLGKKPAGRPSMAELLVELQSIPSSGVKDGPAELSPSAVSAKAKAKSGSFDQEGATSGIIRQHLTGDTTSRGEQVGPSRPAQRGVTVLMVGGTVLLLGMAALLLTGRMRSAPLPMPPPVHAAAGTVDLGMGARIGDDKAKLSGLLPATPHQVESSATPSAGQADKVPPVRKDRSTRKGSHGSKDAKLQLDLWK